MVISAMIFWMDSSMPVKLTIKEFETPTTGSKYSPVARASAAIAAENPTINEIQPLKNPASGW